MDYSIVVPVYKSKESLKTLTQRTSEVFNSTLAGKQFELILVNDSPFDTLTVETLDELHKKYSFVKVIELTQNFGQQSATLCGIHNSEGRHVITMDDDMQHDPYDIPKLIGQQSHDIVIARFKKKKHNIFKRLTSSIKNWFDCLILAKPKHIQATSFRLFNRIIADSILQIKTSYPFIDALLYAVSKDVVNVEVEHHRRQEGRSHYTLKKLIQLFSDLLIGNSSLLLKWIGSMGLILASASMVGALIIIARKIIYNVTLQGWSSIMVTILFFGGTTLFTLGIMGDYLIRIIHTSENKPNYFIRTVHENTKNQ